MDIPAIMVSGGPMLNGYYRGERVGSGPHLWKFSEAVKAPRGAVLKPSAATEALLQRRARAVVFEGMDDFKARIDDENLDFDANCIMVLRPKILRKGVTDIVRISDARMAVWKTPVAGGMPSLPRPCAGGGYRG